MNLAEVVLPPAFESGGSEFSLFNDDKQNNELPASPGFSWENRVGERRQRLVLWTDGSLRDEYGYKMEPYMDGWYIRADCPPPVYIGQRLPGEVQARDAEMYAKGGLALQAYLVTDGIERNLIGINNDPRPEYEPEMIRATRDGQAISGTIAKLALGFAGMLRASGCKGWICFTGETVVLIDEADVGGDSTEFVTAGLFTDEVLLATSTMLVGATVWEVVERRKRRKRKEEKCVSASGNRRDHEEDGERLPESSEHATTTLSERPICTASDAEGVSNFDVGMSHDMPTTMPVESGLSGLSWLGVRHVALAACLLVTALLSGYALWGGADTSASAQTDISVVSNMSGFASRQIKDIRVGDRVVANNPDVETTSQTAVDPETWRLVRMQAILEWDDGTIDDLNIETLQPLDQIAAMGAEVGARIAPPLDLVEMGLPEDLETEVIAIEPCPAIKDGKGRVVRTTVNHLNNQVLELTFENSAGEVETVRPTKPHRFYSVTSKGWIAAEDIEVGEHLVGASGSPVTVVGKASLPGTHRVYNMTVEGEHVYHVTPSGVLAHNNYRKGKGTPTGGGSGDGGTGGSPQRRRTPSTGDQDFPSERAARRQAMRDRDVPTSQANNYERVDVHGKNPNLKGPKGEPSEVHRATDIHGNEVEIPHHKHGHQFPDNTIEHPHYHGPNGEHLTYPPKND